MLLSNQEYVTAANIHISMPFSGVVRVTDGCHSDSFMVCSRKRNRKPKTEGTTLTWGKVSLQPENHMLLCYDGKPLCADYADQRTRSALIPPEELEQVHAEGHRIDGDFRENWPIKVCKTLEPEDAIYGLGDKPGFLNKRNYAYENWNTDDPSPHADSFQRLYKSINFFLILGQNGCCGILADNTYRTYFDFGKQSDRYLSFSHAAGALDYYMIAGKDMKSVLRKYLQITGKPKLQQKWVYGYHQSHWSYASAEKILEVADSMRSNKIPIDAIHMDIDYMDGFRVFTFDQDRFSSPRQLSAALGKKHIKPVAIVDPGIKKDPNYAVYREGIREGHFARNPDGTVYVGRVWPGKAVFPDFTQSKTRTWWADLLKIMLDNGIRGIWNDMNEPANFTGELPDDVQFQAGNHLKIHNVYGHLMAQATYEGLLKAENRRPFVLSRACCAGSQRYCAGWTGDNQSLWAHIQLSLVQMMNLGLSGMYMTGADIGGFAADCTPELLIRWTQAGCLSPFFRNHYAKCTRPQEPYAFDRQTLDACRKAINLRYHLLPYLYDLAHEDLPLLRPLVMEYPNDPHCRNLSDQYLIGSQLMAAPVITPGTGARAVYLPKGVWYDYDTGKRYCGGRYILADAPIDHLPLFAKAGAILPVCEGTPQSTDEISKIVLEIFPGNGSFVHYTDDGETMDYEKGRIHALKITVRGKVVTQSVVQAGYSGEDTLEVLWKG